MRIVVWLHLTSHDNPKKSKITNFAHLLVPRDYHRLLLLFKIRTNIHTIGLLILSEELGAGLYSPTLLPGSLSPQGDGDNLCVCSRSGRTLAVAVLLLPLQDFFGFQTAEIG